MNNYNGTKRTRVVMNSIDSIDKCKDALRRVELRFKFLTTEIESKKVKFDSAESLEEKQEIKNEIEPLINEMKTLKGWHQQLTEKLLQIKENSRKEIEEWNLKIPTL